MAVSAFLGLLAMLSQNLKPYMSPFSAVNFLEALALLTIVFTPLSLLLAKLTQLNNEAAQAIHTSKPRRKIGEGLLTNLRDVQDSNPAAGQDRHGPEPSPPFIPQEMTPVQTFQESLKPIPSQKTIAPAQHVSENKPRSTSPKNVSGHGGAFRPTPAGVNSQQKSKPTIDDVIASAMYSRRLERLVIKQLSQGVRYNKKQHKIHVRHLRHQDLISIWQLGRANKPAMTERSKARLKSLRLITVDRKEKTKKNRVEVVEEVRLTERGYAVRQAIATAANQIMGRAANVAAHA